MPQLTGSCGHKKASYDDHLSCVNCTKCSRSNTCSICRTWPSQTWSLFERRRSYRKKVLKHSEMVRRTNNSNQSPAKTTKEALNEMGLESSERSAVESEGDVDPSGSTPKPDPPSMSGLADKQGGHVARDKSGSLPRDSVRSGGDPSHRVRSGDRSDYRKDKDKSGSVRSGSVRSGTKDTSSGLSKSSAKDKSGPVRSGARSGALNESNSKNGSGSVLHHSKERTDSVRSGSVRSSHRDNPVPKKKSDSSRHRSRERSGSVRSGSVRSGSSRSSGHGRHSRDHSRSLSRSNSRPKTRSASGSPVSIHSDSRHFHRHRRSRDRSRSKERSIYSHRQSRRDSFVPRQLDLRPLGPDPPAWQRDHLSGAQGISYFYGSNPFTHQRHKKKRQHRSSSSSVSYDFHRKHKKSKKHKKDRKRKRSPSPSSTSSDSLSPDRTKRRDSRDSVVRQSIPKDSPRHHSRVINSDDDRISIHARDNEFDDNTSHRSHSTVNQTDQSIEQEESISFSQTIEEIYKLLPAEEYPRDSSPSASLPQSAIERLLKVDTKPSCSLPQAQVIQDTWNYLEKHCDKAILKPDWIVESKVLSKLAPIKSYKCHNESTPSLKAPELDQDGYLLDFSASGSASLPLKNITAMEDQARQLMRILSHADTFSVAAFKCLEQEELNPSILKRILQSLGVSIRHAAGFSSVLTAELFSARRDATIATGKSLSSSAKASLKKVPLTSDTLFGGTLEEVRQKDIKEKRDALVDEASTSKKQFTAPKPVSQNKSKGKKPTPRKPPPPQKPKQDYPKKYSPGKPPMSKDSSKNPFSRKGAGNRRH